MSKTKATGTSTLARATNACDATTNDDDGHPMRIVKHGRTTDREFERIQRLIITWLRPPNGAMTMRIRCLNHPEALEVHGSD
jgi:hypothetical protein